MPTCPWCEPHRARMIFDENRYGWHILCQSCGAQGPVADTPGQAEIYFDTRPEVPVHTPSQHRLLFPERY